VKRYLIVETASQVHEQQSDQGVRSRGRDSYLHGGGLSFLLQGPFSGIGGRRGFDQGSHDPYKGVVPEQEDSSPSGERMESLISEKGGYKPEGREVCL